MQSGNFTCLDSSASFPISALNDDYCDCPDGSDEPGTSACSAGTFWCRNEGHIPGRVLKSRVNDGICGEYRSLNCTGSSGLATDEADIQSRNAVTAPTSTSLMPVRIAVQNLGKHIVNKSRRSRRCERRYVTQPARAYGPC